MRRIGKGGGVAVDEEKLSVSHKTKSKPWSKEGLPLKRDQKVSQDEINSRITKLGRNSCGFIRGNKKGHINCEYAFLWLVEKGK